MNKMIHVEDDGWLCGCVDCLGDPDDAWRDEEMIDAIEMQFADGAPRGKDAR